jgi:ferredoxin
MATYITDACINCGACVPECPNDAISEGGDIYVIDPERCTECVGFHEKEACQAVCPVECCLPDPNRSEQEPALIARAVALHPDDAELKALASGGKFPSRFRN